MGKVEQAESHNPPRGRRGAPEGRRLAAGAPDAHPPKGCGAVRLFRVGFGDREFSLFLPANRAEPQIFALGRAL